MDISGRTRLILLLGYPVEHTLSPAMHNRAFEHMGLDYRYAACPVRPEALGEAVRGLRALGIAGGNVTVPHKQHVVEFLDEVGEEASFIGAVNTIVNQSGRLVGHNTDGRGFMRGLQEAGVEARGRRVTMVGAGGAARAIGYYLAQEAASLHIFDVDRPKLDALVRDLGRVAAGTVHAAADLGSLAGADVVVNATPLGLKPGDPLPFDPARLPGGAAVVDLIYKETSLQSVARARGLRVVDGMGMLLWQGVLAFELWTGAAPPHGLMREALLEAMG